jgi:hypothetical protein
MWMNFCGRFAAKALVGDLLELELVLAQSLLENFEVVDFILRCFVVAKYFFEDAYEASFI